MMAYILKVTSFGFLSGILGASAGGLLAQFVKGKSSRVMSFLLEFTAGYMISVVCFDLLAVAMQMERSPLIIILGFALGVAATMLIQQRFKYSETSIAKKTGNSVLGTGFTMLFSIGMHNLPEGLAVGAGFIASQALGLEIMLAILLHDIPEGVAVAGPLTAGGLEPYKSFLYAAASSAIPMGLGAFIGAAFGSISSDVLTACFAFAAGTMMYVVMGDLIPESKGMYRGRFPVIGNIVGFLAGTVMTMLI